MGHNFQNTGISEAVFIEERSVFHFCTVHKNNFLPATGLCLIYFSFVTRKFHSHFYVGRTEEHTTVLSTRARLHLVLKYTQILLLQKRRRKICLNLVFSRRKDVFCASVALHHTARSKPSVFVHGVYLFWAAICDVWHSERESVFIDTF